MIFTFYSYKGGVGRSMALANLGEWLWRQGLRVVMIDWDLEAPGLESFFFPPGERVEAVRSELGLIDVLATYKRAFPKVHEALRTAVTSDGGPAQGPSLKGQDAIAALDLERKVAVLDSVLPPISAALFPLRTADPATIPGPGALWLLSAGWRSGERLVSYARAVQEFDWDEFYSAYEGQAYFEWMRRQLSSPSLADVVLIDSRTGVTEMGGVCTRQLADVVVILCAPNVQNLEGMVSMAKSFNREDLATVRGRGVDIVLVPARIDNFNETRLNEFRREFESSTELFTPTVFRRLKRSFWGLRIPYTPGYAYQERLAIGDENPVEELEDAYKRLAAHLAMLVPPQSTMRRRLGAEIERVFGRLLPTVAIAYAPADRALAEDIRHRLEAANLTVWPEPVDPVENRLAAQQGILEQSHFLVVPFTGEAVRSAPVRAAWRQARRLGVCVVPIRPDSSTEPDPKAVPAWMYQQPIRKLDGEWDQIVSVLGGPWVAQRVPLMAPELSTTYVQREETLTRLKDLLLRPNGPSRVALYGLRGSGKTTIAAAFCRDDDVESFYRDGILWASAAPGADIKDELCKVHEALTGEKPSFVDAAQAAQAIGRRSSGKRLLMVIDEATDAEAVRVFPLDIPSCRYLITTPDRSVGQRAEAETLELDPMSGPEAAALLRLQLGPEATDDRVVDNVAFGLRSHPQALKTAAALIRSEAQGPNEEMDAGPTIRTVSRVPERFVQFFAKRLGTGVGDDVTGALDEALGRLSDQDGKRLARLVFTSGHGGIPIAHLAERWRADPTSADRTLTRLADLSLVHILGGEVTLDPLVRELVAARFPDQDVDRIHERAFSELSPEERKVARQVLCRLVRLTDDGTGFSPRQISLAQLTATQNILVPRLEQLLLIVRAPTARGSIMLADPAACDQWRRLGSWLEEDRDFLAWRQRIGAYCIDWERTHDTGTLLSGAVLEEARREVKTRAADFSPSETAYIEESIRWADASAETRVQMAAASRSAKTVFASPGRVLLAVGLLAVFAIFTWSRLPLAQHTRREADEHLLRADSLAERDELDAAVQEYSLAAERNVSDPAIYVKRGIAYRQLTNGLDKAIADFTHALLLDPKLADAYALRGSSRVEAGDVKAGFADLDQAISLDPRNAQTYYSRAAARAAQRDSEGALADYTKAIELDLSFAQAYLNRARLYEAKGDMTRAIDDLQNVLKVSKDPLVVTAANARLEMLGARQPGATKTVVDVHLHVTDVRDKPTAEKLAEGLRARGYTVSKTELYGDTRTGGEVRCTNRDQSTAREIAGVVENALAGAGYPVRMRVRVKIDGKADSAWNEASEVRPGLIEVWLPPLLRAASAF